MRIAILGFGSVGRGIARVLLAKDLGIAVTGLADSKSGIIDAGGIDLAAALARKEGGGPCGNPGVSPADVVAKAEYDVLVEVTPTNVETGEPALGHIREALRRHKHVVTSNKGPIALDYPGLRALAEANGVLLKYEATVCGAIPLIHAMQEGLAGNTISRLYGVFNGTCNYILTRMAAEGLTYEQALAEARELGYAEADPTYDVEGIDAGIKLVILANTILDLSTTLDDVEDGYHPPLARGAAACRGPGLHHPADRRDHTGCRGAPRIAADHTQDSSARRRRNAQRRHRRGRPRRGPHVHREGRGLHRDGQRRDRRSALHP